MTQSALADFVSASSLITGNLVKRCRSDPSCCTEHRLDQARIAKKMVGMSKPAKTSTTRENSSHASGEPAVSRKG